MRLPFSKIYRAFPELDRFSDEECNAFVHRATWGHIRSQLLVAPIAIVAALGTGWLAGFALAEMWDALFRNQLITAATLELWRMITTVFGAVSSGAIAALAIRDLWLRQVVKGYIGSNKCPKCSYLLLGLTASNGILSCPECGTGINMELVGLKQSDLTPGS